jgi:hypothetical protein
MSTGVSDASPVAYSGVVCMPCIVQAGAYFSEQLNESLVDALLEYGEKQLVSLYTGGDSYGYGYGICHGKAVQSAREPEAHGGLTAHCRSLPHVCSAMHMHGPGHYLARWHVLSVLWQLIMPQHDCLP